LPADWLIFDFEDAAAPTAEDGTRTTVAAQAEGKGIMVVDGKPAENLHVGQARRTLRPADVIATWRRLMGPSLSPRARGGSGEGRRAAPSYPQAMA
jgi:citrate lyase beta subunit